MTKEEGKEYAVPENMTSNYVSFNVVKNNYGPTDQRVWMKKNVLSDYSVSVLASTNMQKPATQPRSNSLQAKIIEFVANNARKHSKTHLREHLGGIKGKLAASKADISSAIATLLEAGKLVTITPTDEERKRLKIPPQVRETLDIAKPATGI
jgi:predicted HTH transcriptional regulator